MIEKMPERMRKLRKAKGITIKDLSEIIGADRSTMSRWEKGYRTPDAEILFKLADYYGVSMDYLAGRTDNKRVNK